MAILYLNDMIVNFYGQYVLDNAQLYYIVLVSSDVLSLGLGPPARPKQILQARARPKPELQKKG